MIDCLVVGGGIIGLSTARALSIAGFNPTLVDKKECGTESSWAGAGILSPLYPWKYSDTINELSLKSQQQYLKFCNELLRQTGINPEYIKSGLLMLDEFDKKEAKNWLKKWNIGYKINKNSALFDVAQVRNSKILPALKQDLINRDITIVENTKINLTFKNNRVIVKNFKAKNIIICTGSWSADFGIKIYPVKGEMIAIFDPLKTIKNIILKKGKYIVPRQDGVVLVGSTMENIGFNKSLNLQTKNNLFNFANSIFPHLKTAKITHHWCGFRPGNDTDPIIKQDEKYNNLFFNTGHFCNGLNTAIASSDIITNLIINSYK